MKAFGQGGAGLFVAPTAIAEHVCRQYDVREVGRIDSVVEQFYAITTERRMRHPATLAVSQAAAREVFGVGGARGIPSGNGVATPQRKRRSPSRNMSSREFKAQPARSVKAAGKS
jgi:hypothetical protein